MHKFIIHSTTNNLMKSMFWIQNADLNPDLEPRYLGPLAVESIDAEYTLIRLIVPSIVTNLTKSMFRFQNPYP